MKTFCALLIVATFAYVHASEHPCDPLAANTVEKPASTGEHTDQVISLDNFIPGTKNVYFVTKASSSSLPDANKHCNPATHGSDCKAVKYYRKITHGPGSYDAKDIKMNTVSVGVTGAGTAIRYEMNLEGINEDDYIFKIAKETTIKAEEYSSATEKVDISGSIPTDIREALEKEFALYHTESGFSLYITCDAKTMWVSYDQKKLNDITATSARLAEVVGNLQKVAREKFKAHPTMIDVTQDFPDKFKSLIPAAA